MLGCDHQPALFDAAQHDYSFHAGPISDESYSADCAWEAAAAVAAFDIGMGDYFQLALVYGGSMVVMEINVETGTVSPRSLGMPGYVAPIADRIIDPPVVGE